MLDCRSLPIETKKQFGNPRLLIVDDLTADPQQDEDNCQTLEKIPKKNE